MEKLELTSEESILFQNYYNLTDDQKNDIKERRRKFGMTVDEISRKYQITPPDVNRILNPPKNYGYWSSEEKLRHWIAGKRRAATVKRQRDENKNLKIKIC